MKSHAAKRMVMKPCYRSQVVKSKKGKGSFKRQDKHKKATLSGG
jgi:stalled ribosome alternative rescue factor ArfA